MRLHQIDLNLLVAFEAIYREQNLTRAAQKLHVTQPALSHTLGRLRELFGDALFSRNGRVMVPTAMARDLIGPVRQALTTLEHGLFPSQGFDPARSDRRFHVAVREAFEIMWLPPLITAVRKQAPHLQLVSVRMSQPAQLETELSAGTIDLALDLPLPVSSAIHHQELGQEGELCVMARRNHPAFKKKLTLERYLAASHILVSSRRRGPGVEDMALRNLGHRRAIAVRCQSYLAAAHVASESDLLLTLPKRMARALTHNTSTVMAKLPITTPAIGVRMYWHNASDNDPANTWLRGLIAALAKKA